MAWYDDIRITESTFEEMGIVFFIREIMHNRLRLSMWDADILFGPGWWAKVDKLSRRGLIVAERCDGEMLLKVVAKGDGRRLRQKNYMKKIRERKRS